MITPQHMQAQMAEVKRCLLILHDLRARYLKGGKEPPPDLHQGINAAHHVLGLPRIGGTAVVVTRRSPGGVPR